MEVNKTTITISNRQRAFFPLLMILIFVNIMIRYPTTPHEIGWDTYVIHSMAHSISEEGQAIWIINPLSYFGMYPGSYPSAVPFLISSFSQLSGLNIDSTIWFYNVILGVLGALGAFMFAGMFKKNFWFQYAVALFFSTSMGVLLVTTWSLSTRGTLIVLLPIFLWILIRAHKQLEPSFVLGSVVFLYVMATVHRMFVLIIPFGVLFIFTKQVVNIKMKIKSHIKPSKHQKFRVIAFVLFIIITSFLFLYPLIGGFSDVYIRFVKFSDIINMLIYGLSIFALNIGTLGFFALIGVFLLAIKSGKNRAELLILGTASLISPMMLIGKYISTFSILFVMILAGYGLILLQKRLHGKKKQFMAIAVTIIITSFLLSGYAQVYRFNIFSEADIIDARYLEIEGYDSALWIRENDVGTYVGSYLVSMRMSAISNVPMFPGQGPLNIIYGHVNEYDMRIEKRSVFDLMFYTDSPIFDADKSDTRVVWYGGDLARTSVRNSNAQYVLNQFNVQTLVVNNYESTHSIFANSIMQTSYCTFHNQKVQIYHIEIPR